ncbi:MAG: Mrp/NBP35 family ATP-binding protein [Bacillota bacterium]|nr:Mrp/NBP35 family ATP-binding protein [Bacillota bacterium]
MSSDKSSQEEEKTGLEKILRPGIKHVIAVGSGKGGVGKSSVTSLLAVGASREGFKVGILDADITGPSIPKMFGIKKALGTMGFDPTETSQGIRIMSLNLLLSNEEDPVIWRGPLIGGAVKQFWADVEWGELDYLFIDLPPGTADAPLTVMQTIPLDGLVIVSSPQDLAVMVVKKALKMAKAMNISVLGLVENMSYLICPHCQAKVEVFGSSKGEEVAELTGVPLIAILPLDKKLAECCDNGTVEDYESELFKKLLSVQQVKMNAGGMNE